MLNAPFPPLAPSGADLDSAPASPAALRARMAAVYSVDEAALLPVRGRLHAIELVMRRAARDGFASIALAAPNASTIRLAHIARIALAQAHTKDAAAVILASPGAEAQPTLTLQSAAGRAAAIAPAQLVVDESFIEFSGESSLAEAAAASANLVVMRSLEYAYGLAGAPCGCLIASPAQIARYEEGLEPAALPTPIQRLALAALDPSRMAASVRRIGDIKAERARVCAALTHADAADAVVAGGGPFVYVRPRLRVEAERALRQFGVSGAWLEDGRFRIDLGEPASNDRALEAFGVIVPPRARRRAEVVRETAETSIVVQIDLDAAAPPQIDTGIAFFDHMLSQVAQHGGFSLALTCNGDLAVDAHHSVEDCALALGQALKQALGERRGIARFGFVLPMDEAEAKVSIDLGGRPYLVFEAAFAAPLLGAYPTEMTEHVFRSLAQSLGAAIHVSVSGQNDHHKTEACFKALGRTLRDAIRIEGDLIPSTKGAL